MTRQAVGLIPSYQMTHDLKGLSDRDTATKGLKDFLVNMHRASIFLSRHIKFASKQVALKRRKLFTLDTNQADFHHHPKIHQRIFHHQHDIILPCVEIKETTSLTTQQKTKMLVTKFGMGVR